MATYPVKFHSSTLKIIARDVGGYNYSYGNAIPVFHEADITEMMEGRNQDDAGFIADMLYYVASKAIRAGGKQANQPAPSSEPKDGCTMVCFYEPGKGVESARVSLTHPGSGTEVIGYGRTVASAIEKANGEMAKLLKGA